MTNDELLLEISNVMQLQIQPVCEKLDQIENRLDSVENRMDRIDSRLDSLENKMVQIEGRLDSLENKMVQIEGRLDSLENKMDLMEVQLNDFKSQMDGFNIRLKKVEVFIETEVLPLQRELSSYGLSTYQRYQNSMEKLELLEKNQQILMRVVAEHSKEIKRLS